MAHEVNDSIHICVPVIRRARVNVRISYGAVINTAVLRFLGREIERERNEEIDGCRLQMHE